MAFSKEKWEQSTNNYLKYSGLAFQMIGIIGIFTFGGLWLDKKLSWKFPIFTILLTITGVALSIYSGLKDFIKTKK